MDRKEAAAKAKALVAQMTLEEKAGQLRYDAPAIPRLGVPTYNWWNEALHGVARAGQATSYPQAIGLAAMFDDELLEQLGDVSATEGRAKYNALSKLEDRDIYKGLTFWSPNINIFRDPRWGRGHETYGEDPYLTSRLGKAYVHGLQGDGPVMKAAACAKHLAVHSGPEDLRHHFNAVATPKDMEETYLPAFEACIKDAKVESVMGAYNRTNGEPCCGSKALLVDLVRGKYEFEGHIVSDCWAIRDFHSGHNVTDTPAESAALAMKMGCDLNCGNTYLHMMAAYEQGLVTEEQITTAAERLFTTRYLLGIMEGQSSQFDEIPYTAIECPEHLALAKEASLKSCVLLKNDGILPLNPETVGTVGVIGPNANSRVALIGNYHGTASRYVTVQEGIQNALEGKARVLVSEGCGLWQDKVEALAWNQDRISEAVAVAQNSDTVILVVGLDESLEGEEMDQGNHVGSGDKKDLLLPEVQRELMEKVLAVGKPTVICLMAGSAIDLQDAGEKANGVLLTWYPGAAGGTAVADLLFGKVSPSGKLPVTFYHNETLDRLPAFTDYAMTGRTYRYLTEEPIYPFGFGLSYGNVLVTELEADKQKARVRLVNQSEVATEDVVQLYLKDEKSSLAAVNPILCGFQRVKLAAGETTEVDIAIDPKAFTVVDEQGQRIPGSGSWTLYAGTSQPDSLSQKLSGKECISVALSE